MSDETKSTRLHIGNISSNLAEKKSTLSARLTKYGTITSDLTIHTKPLQDFYFGYVTMDLSDAQFEKLKGALNGVQFMGRKLTVARAKSDWKAAWEKDHKRVDSAKSEREMRNRIAEAREKRIKEASTPLKVNAVTNNLLASSCVNSNNTGYGYHISSHTYNNISANTKNKPPTHLLAGTKSYASWTNPSKRDPSSQQYSKISGGSEVIKGRHRKTPRAPEHFIKRQQTMRILINGELKFSKCYKTKLWGFERNKSLNDLTYKFVNGVWRSGDNHIIDTNTNTRKLMHEKCGITGDGATSYGQDIAHDNEESTDDENQLLSQENAKNKAVLAAMFSKFDFDKPVEVEDDPLGIDKEDILYDSKGRRKVVRYDYEIQGGLDSDNEDDFEMEDLNQANTIIETYKSSVEKPQQEVYFDEDDEGNEIDLDELGQQYTTEAIKHKYDAEHEFEVVTTKEDPTTKAEGAQDEDIDDEFMPTFGSMPQTAVLNDTETLRTLFNPNDGDKGGFKLALSEDDEDIDEEKVVDTKQQEDLLQQIKKQQEEEFIKQQAAKFGLFWYHADSHFLQTQTQLSKIAQDNVKLPGEQDESLAANALEQDRETDYEKWFWSMRGEISRECKRRKRDVNRIFKKKSRKSTIV